MTYREKQEYRILSYFDKPDEPHLNTDEITTELGPFCGAAALKIVQEMEGDGLLHVLKENKPHLYKISKAGSIKRLAIKRELRSKFLARLGWAITTAIIAAILSPIGERLINDKGNKRQQKQPNTPIVLPEDSPVLKANRPVIPKDSHAYANDTTGKQGFKN